MDPISARRIPAAVIFLVVLCVLVGLGTLVVDGWYLWLAADDRVAEPVGGMAALVVRALWAATRGVVFLLLPRALLRGSPAARPVGIVLAVSTGINVLRLGQELLVPALAVTALSAAVVVVFATAPSIRDHLRRVPGERRSWWRRLVEAGVDDPTAVVAARALSLLLVPLSVAPLLVAGTVLVSGDTTGDGPAAAVGAVTRIASVSVLIGWAALLLAVQLVVPYLALALTAGLRRVRWLLAAVAVVVGFAVPVCCALLLGVDGLFRDGVPVALAAAGAFYGLLVDPATRRWAASRRVA